MTISWSVGCTASTLDHVHIYWATSTSWWMKSESTMRWAKFKQPIILLQKWACCKHQITNYTWQMYVYMHHSTFSLWCHLAQHFFGDSFCTSRKARQGEVSGCTWRVQTAWLLLGIAASGHSRTKPLVCNVWAISLLLCMNGLRKQSSCHAGPTFLAVKLVSHSVRATIGQELWLLKAH